MFDDALDKQYGAGQWHCDDVLNSRSAPDCVLAFLEFARAPATVAMECYRCHSFVRQGSIEFLSDSTHALAGQTVPMPDWPYAPGTYGGIEEPEYEKEIQK